MGLSLSREFMTTLYRPLSPAFVVAMIVSPCLSSRTSSSFSTAVETWIFFALRSMYLIRLRGASRVYIAHSQLRGNPSGKITDARPSRNFIFQFSAIVIILQCYHSSSFPLKWKNLGLVKMVWVETLSKKASSGFNECCS